MMEPVEIDFIYGGNTQTEGKKIEQSMDNISAASKKAQADVSKAAAAQAAVIKQIEADIKSIENQISKAAPGSAKMQLTQELGYAKRALEEEKAALNDVNASIELTGQKHTKLRTQVMEAKQALAEMEMQGKRGTPEYTAAAAELGRLNDQMGDTAAQAKILADDQKGFRAVVSGVSGLAGAMSAATGAAALFGAENEDLAKIQTRLQAVMAITIGLQQVAEVLNKDSYFSVVLLSKAQEMWAVANLKVATTLGITTVQAQILMATLTLGLSVAITAIVAGLSIFISKQNEAKKKNEEFTKSIVDSSSAAITKIQLLSAEWKSLGDNLNAKKKFIDENKKAFEDLGVSIKGVSDAENLLNLGTQSFINAQISKAKAVALLNSEVYKNALQQSIEADQNLKSSTTEFKQKTGKTASVRKLGNGDFRAVEGNIDFYNAVDQQQEANKILGSLYKQVISYNKEADDYLAKAGIKKYEDEKKVTEKAGKAEINLNVEIQNKLNAIRKQSSDLALQRRKDEMDKMNRLTGEQMDKEYERLKKSRENALLIEERLTDERVRIEKDYEKQIEDVKLNQKSYLVAALEAERDAKISAVSMSLLEETELYKTATNDQLMISKELTGQLIAELKKRILADKTLTQEDRDKKLAELNKSEYTVQKSNNPFADLIDGVEKYKKAREAQSKTNAETDIVGFAKLEGAANDAQKATLEAAAGAFQGISAIISEVVSSLDNLSEAEKKSAENAIQMLEGAANIAQGLADKNPIAVIQGMIQLATAAYQELDTKTKDINNRIAASKKAVEELAKAYDKLGIAISKAYSSEKASLLLKQQQNLEARKSEIEKQIAAEEEKIRNAKEKEANIDNGKNPFWIFNQIGYWLSDKGSQDAVDQAGTDLEEINKQLEENADAIIESLTGTSVSSAIDEFANAYADAFTSGEDAALKSADIVKNILKTALIEKLKNDLKPGITTLMNMVSNAMADQFLSDKEKAEIYAQNEKNNQDAAKNQKMFEELGFTSDTSKQKGIQGDVAKMTEETGSALTGQITAMRLNVVALLNNSKSSLDAVGKVLATLEKIKDNTDRLNRMDETLYYLKINGIKVQ